MWETTIEKTRTISQRTIGRYLCTVIDYGRAIRWYVQFLGIFFGGTGGECVSIEDGQRQAEVCATELNQALFDDAARRAAVREGGDE